MLRILLISALFTNSYVAFSQENTAILCSDLLDNDGDGLCDCADPECIDITYLTNFNDNCNFFPGFTYADFTIDKNQTCDINIDQTQDPLGIPDQIAIQLGPSGHVYLGYDNNMITNTGDDRDDIYIFCGLKPETRYSISVSSADANTINILRDVGLAELEAVDYFQVGFVENIIQTGQFYIHNIDLDSNLNGLAEGILSIDRILIVDHSNVDCPFSPSSITWQYTFIDAVGGYSNAEIDCNCQANGSHQIDQCGLCLETADPDFDQTCIDCNGILNGNAIEDECGVCLDLMDPDFDQSCIDCNGTPNGNFIQDNCGNCLEPSDPNFNQGCDDCNGMANGPSVLDECGVCLDPSDPEFNQSCLDCAGVINGEAVMDECGNCLNPDDQNFNQSCADCNGTLNGFAVLDDCGECLEASDPNFNQSCMDCNGTAGGSAMLDECGDCKQPDDPTFNESCKDCNEVINGTSIIDECGVCLEESDPLFNASCLTISEKEVFIPNVMSIDTDEDNHLFIINSANPENIQSVIVNIFDRQGQLIYDSGNFSLVGFNDWWDGTATGEELYAGTYVYRVEVTYINDEELVEMGTVTLVR